MYIHFRDYLKTHEFCDDGRSEILQMFTLIQEKSLGNIFPNVNVALRIHLSLFVTNCSGGRSFSKRIKNYLRNAQLKSRIELETRFAIHSIWVQIHS